MANAKFKWETPELVNLSKNISYGACGVGASDADCNNGTLASANCIGGGAAAAGLCAAGTVGFAPTCTPGGGV